MLAALNAATAKIFFLDRVARGARPTRRALAPAPFMMEVPAAADPRLVLTEAARDDILQHHRETGYCFLDVAALDEWLEHHDVDAICRGRTLLVWALHRRRYSAVKALLERGADVMPKHRPARGPARLSRSMLPRRARTFYDV